MATLRAEPYECRTLPIDDLGFDPRSYPSTRQATGVVALQARFQSWVLESESMWVRVVPELGGRIVEIGHRPSGRTVLDPGPALRPVSSWSEDWSGPCHVRDAFLPHGVQLLAPARQAVMTPQTGLVDALEHSAEDGGICGVDLASLIPGTPLGFQLRYALGDARAELSVDVAVQNRSLAEVATHWSALAVGMGGSQEAWTDATGAVSLTYDRERDVGLAVLGDPVRTGYARSCAGLLERGRFLEGGLLAPRQIDPWSVGLVPLAGLGLPIAATRDVFLGLVGSTLTALSVGDVPEAVVYVLTERGLTLEARLDLKAGVSVELQAPEGLCGVVVRDSAGVELLRWSLSEGLERLDVRGHAPPSSASTLALAAPNAGGCEGHYLSAARARAEGADPGADLDRASDAPALRALCLVQSAMHELRSMRYGEAIESLERALGFNAEDPLVWWLKAVSQRLAGVDDADAPELPNAHFLAPLEPALRAEAFLSMPQAMASDPHPILAPLCAQPDHAVEAVCLLVDAGLWGEAARLIDELLRHADLAMVRCLLAYCHLVASGLEAEAADQVAKAGRLPDRPPWPWRPVERLALEALAERFPGDEPLGRLLERMRRATDRKAGASAGAGEG